MHYGCVLCFQSFPFNVGERVKLVERPEPLEMKRVDSIFKERIERHKEELAELEEETKVIRRPLPVRRKLWRNSGPRAEGRDWVSLMSIVAVCGAAILWSCVCIPLWAHKSVLHYYPCEEWGLSHRWSDSSLVHEEVPGASHHACCGCYSLHTCLFTLSVIGGL